MKSGRWHIIPNRMMHTLPHVLTIILTSLSMTASVELAQADGMEPTKPVRAHGMQQTLHLPANIRARFLAGMRQHLSEISDIQAALANGDFERAAQIAQTRLGLNAPGSAACRMDSMADQKTGAAAISAFPRITSHLGGDAGIAPYMPKAMHDVGVKMHQAADHFAEVSRASAATKDYPAALSALSAVTTQCIACHAQFTTETQ